MYSAFQSKGCSTYLLLLVQLFFVTGISRLNADRPNCEDRVLKCPCGISGELVNVTVKMCAKPKNNKNKFVCVSCTEKSDADICNPFKNCDKCYSKDHCASCPFNRFGEICDKECQCKNGGSCEMFTGACNCLKDFEGQFCQLKKNSSCLLPLVPQNGIVMSDIGSTYREGSRIIYKCEPRYVLVGSLYRICQPNGLWSDEVPKCVAVCPLPQRGNNLRMIINPRKGSEKDASGKQIVKDLGFRCEEGFELVGERILTCLPDGRWSANPPVCKEKMCQDPPVISNGQVNIPVKLVLAGEIHYHCDDDFILIGNDTLKCLANGTWSGQIPQCVNVKMCSDPGLIPHSDRKPGIDTNFLEGTTVTYKCKNGFMILGDAERKCEPNRNWSGTSPRCAKITSGVTCLTRGRDIMQGHGEPVWVVCPAGCNSATEIYGTSIYNEISSVCKAAIHSGMMTNKGGSVIMTNSDFYAMFIASISNSVRSLGSSSVSGSFHFLYIRKDLLPKEKDVDEVTCNTTGQDAYNSLDNRMRIVCPPGCLFVTDAQVFGSDIYSETSSICRAAIHNGKISNNGGVMYILKSGSFNKFLPSIANSVESYRSTTLMNSFRFVDSETKPPKNQEPDQCPSNWQVIEDSCMLIATNPKTWHEANSYCDSRGSHLVILDNEKINIAVIDALIKAGLDKSWTGLVKKSRNYHWVDGKRLSTSTYSAWGKEEPNGRGDCVVISSDDAWHDEACSSKLAFVCQLVNPDDFIDMVCADPGQVENGLSHKGDHKDLTFYEGADIRYTCNPLSFMRGHSELICLDTGRWSSDKPECVQLPICEEPQTPKNAIMDIIPPNQRFRRNISRSTAKPRLNPELEEALRNATIPPGYHKVGTKIRFHCETRHYELLGSKTSTCLANGKWSNRLAACIPVCGVSSYPKISYIVNGNVSEVGQWPWQAALSRRIPGQTTVVIICGGVLLNEQWIMTAAHCVSRKNSADTIASEEFSIFLGKYYRDVSEDDKHVQRIEVSEIISHPDFDHILYDYDIALIRLAKPGILEPRVRPICLPQATSSLSSQHLTPGNTGIIIGWGNTKTTHSDRLLYASIPIVSNEECAKDYHDQGIPIVVTKNMFCAGFADGSVDACSGDSGGPVVFSTGIGENIRWTVEGIVSWGSPNGCALPKQYGGYTRVERFLDWIHQYI